MLILSKLLYLFCTQIIPLLRTFISSVQKLFNTYIWNCKLPRCSLIIMLKHRKHDGMGVPNVKAYYKACVIDQHKYWWTPSKHKSWTPMEATNILHKDLKLALIVIKLGAPIPTSLFPTVRVSTKLWSELPLSFSPSGSLCKIPTPIAVRQHFIPCLDLKLWKSKGFTLLIDLYQDTSLHYFGYLAPRFNLSPLQTFPTYKCKPYYNPVHAFLSCLT